MDLFNRTFLRMSCRLCGCDSFSYDFEFCDIKCKRQYGVINYQKGVNQEVLAPIIDKLDELITVLKSIAQHNK